MTGSQAIVHNFRLFAIFVPNIITIDGNLRKLWQKTILLVFYWNTVYNHDKYCQTDQTDFYTNVFNSFDNLKSLATVFLIP